MNVITDVAAAPPDDAPARGGLPLFVATILVGSFLLFLMQPMVARMALPRIGGAPAVWNSAMLVYQALLLGGYAYAHWLGGRPAQRQRPIHLLLLLFAALWLPVGLRGAGELAERAPLLGVPLLIGASVGPLFFAVAAQAPLMQRWYALSRPGADPYWLYAVSNLGSFAGLLAYPLLLEPAASSSAQGRLWAGGYALLVLLVAACSLRLPRGAASAGDAPTDRSPAPPLRRRLLWVALVAVPSGLLLSTTTHLTTDLVAMPLIWVVPLGLYLLSFTVAFAERRGAADFVTAVTPPALLLGGGFAFAGNADHPWLFAGLVLLLQFLVAVALHARLHALRPAPDRLTSFYLLMAVGGALGGLFCAVIAPVLFDWTYEHPLLLLAAAALLPLRALAGVTEPIWRGRHARFLAWALGLLLLLVAVVASQQFARIPQEAVAVATVLLSFFAVLAIGRRGPFVSALAALMLAWGGAAILRVSAEDGRVRSYFGVYAVSTSADGGTRTLTHGTTVHGIQRLGAGLETRPISYYAPPSGVGLALTHAPALFGHPASVGVVGLGSGTLACYARPGQDWRFYEIDPAVVEIARDARRFTYLSRCLPNVPVRLGDARLTLAREPAGSLDLLAVDAFSSDAVPTHLLTREAFRVYARALGPDGVLLIHISNRFVDLEPVLAAAAAAEGWAALVRDYVPTAPEETAGYYSSDWVAFSRDPAKLAALAALGGPDQPWRTLDARPGFAGWTDDYASILPVLRRPRP